MSKVDLTLALIIIAGAYSGFRDGFRVEIFSNIAVLLGVLFGFKLMGYAMLALQEEFYIDEFALPYISFGAVFFLVLLIVNLVARIIVNRFPEPLLGMADPYAAAILGLFRTTFMISLILWILDSLKIQFPEDWTADSWLWQKVAHFAPETLRAIGNVVPFFEDLI